MDPALMTMMLALDNNPMLGAAGRGAFLRARWHDGLRRFSGRLVCEQTWKPYAGELEARKNECELPVGLIGADDGEKFSLVLVRPLRQREQAYFDFARGLDLLEPDGTLLVSMHNDWGASRCEKELQKLAGTAGTLSKNHCRAFWVTKTAAPDEARLTDWRALGTLRKVEATSFISAPGLFGWDKIDAGSKLLTEHLPAQMGGRAADLGAGWGYLSDFLLRHRPHLKRLDLFEADLVALEAARQNLAGFAASTRVEFHWHDVTQGLGGGSYDWIVMNPPFHEGRAANPLLGQRFITAGIEALRPGGQLWLVANRNLPYEQFLMDALPDAHRVVQTDNYKILAGRRN